MVDYLLQLPRGKFVIPSTHPMLSGGAAALGSIGTSIGQISRAVFVGGGGSWKDAAANGGLTLAVTALAGLALAAAVFYSSSGRLKSPWFRRKRKHILSPDQWRNSFTPEGKLRDNGVKFLKKVRSGGVDPSIRAEVWPFLLGVYDLTSSKEERDLTRTKNRKEYEKLRRQCRRLLKRNNSSKHSESNESGETISPGTDSPASEDVESARQSLSSERRKQIIESYSSMDEILRECNAMAGHLDVWKLLDDAHDLVVTLHEKIGT
ncbi:Ypt/Rab-GAP domain of gyp1p superfamily protein [Striga hermonthica]|uniref:Ypt/Rab-GAP domain of gyp1p superfamily protein n=1 Tax=Striga hermonthica TaxID=68872 RepID=A0A9N7MPS8_STRHE|nr:Ypt/Rab-GAP domain of gyp1p superfamily protein [Striga hermonthica]